MTPKYHDIRAILVGLTNDSADLRIGDVRMWVKKTDMSFASWYLLQETIPGHEVTIKVMARAL